MGSGYLGYFEARRSRRQAERHADEAKREEEIRQGRIDGNINRVRELFGVDTYADLGDAPGGFTEAAPSEWRANAEGGSEENPDYDAWLDRKDAHEKESAAWGKKNASRLEAKKNKAKLDSWLDEYGGAVTEANNVDLDDKFTAATTSNRWTLADQGLLGGSADAGVQRNQISELVAGRQRAVAAGRDARRSVQNTLTNQRMNLEGQAAAGTNLNMDFRGIQDQTDMGLDTARSQIVPTAIGNSITTIGQGVGRYQANQGGRNNNNLTGGTTNNSTSGTITGGR